MDFDKEREKYLRRRYENMSPSERKAYLWGAIAMLERLDIKDFGTGTVIEPFAQAIDWSEALEQFKLIAIEMHLAELKRT